MAIETFRPNAGGTTTELTRWPGAASPDSDENYKLVDEETPDEGSTMVYRGVESYELDTYNIPDHSQGSGTINHIKVYSRMQNDTALGKVAIRTHSTEYYGNEENLTASWVNYSKQWDTNPNTGSAWTRDEIDALEIGVALKAGAGPVSSRCTQVYAEVDYAVRDLSDFTGRDLSDDNDEFRELA